MLSPHASTEKETLERHTRLSPVEMPSQPSSSASLALAGFSAARPTPLKFAGLVSLWTWSAVDVVARHRLALLRGKVRALAGSPIAVAAALVLARFVSWLARGAVDVVARDRLALLLDFLSELRTRWKGDIDCRCWELGAFACHGAAVAALLACARCIAGGTWGTVDVVAGEDGAFLLK